jgi:hypothetical protein
MSITSVENFTTHYWLNEIETENKKITKDWSILQLDPEKMERLVDHSFSKLWLELKQTVCKGSGCQRQIMQIDERHKTTLLTFCNQ